MDTQNKVQWLGRIVSIQPRTNVWRYVLDNRTHSHIGYNLFLDGTVNGVSAQFAVAISEKQQQCGDFRIGDIVKGTAWTKKYPGWEYADYYRAGALKRVNECEEIALDTSAPPWRTAPPRYENI